MKQMLIKTYISVEWGHFYKEVFKDLQIIKINTNEHNIKNENEIVNIMLVCCKIVLVAHMFNEK